MPQSDKKYMALGKLIRKLYMSIGKDSRDFVLAAHTTKLVTNSSSNISMKVLIQWIGA